MHYVIGTDEAGYGPNLGPLVISATVWELPEPVADDDLRPLLDDVFRTADAGPTDACRLAVDDSKKLYHPGGSCARLELPLLAVLGAQARRPQNWQEIWEVLAADDTPRLADEFWWSDARPVWPVACQGTEVDAWAAKIQAASDANNIRCIDIRSSVIVPAHFNELVAQYGNKATVLSRCTFELIRRVVGPLGAGTCSIICDRHSGRSSYRPLLQDVFQECLIEVWEEGPHCSRYRWGAPAGRTEIRFLTGGEDHLPVALASMASKYLRELAMGQFNAFWSRHVADLRPTAGYPVDAKRFRQAVESTREKLKIEDHQFWRSR